MNEKESTREVNPAILLVARTLLVAIGLVGIGVAVAMWTGAVVTVNQPWWGPVVIAAGGASMLFCAFLEAPAAVLGSLIVAVVAWN